MNGCKVTFFGLVHVFEALSLALWLTSRKLSRLFLTPQLPIGNGCNLQPQLVF
jgi:hypothetical protein